MSMTPLSFHLKPRIKLFSPKLNFPLRDSKSSFSLPSIVNTTGFNVFHGAQCRLGSFNRTLDRFPLKSYGFIVKAQNEGDASGAFSEQEMEDRGPTSMPERFRYLTKEAPDKPLVWPWLVVLGFMLYTWRSVVWELSNWAKLVSSIGNFFIYISKLALAMVFHFIGDPITSLIWVLETTFYKIRSIYSGIIAYAPIKELVLIIILSSSILAVAEATVPDSVNSQPKLLTITGLIGFAAVANYISEPFFWTLLLGLFSFAKLVKKRDIVSSALPVAAVMVAVGEPWIRVITMVSFLALAIFHHYNNSLDSKEGQESGAIYRVPAPLYCTAFAIGIRLAANWAGYRHLTWMVV